MRDCGDAYQVSKVKHLKVDAAEGRTRVVYNDRITIEGIPVAATPTSLGHARPSVGDGRAARRDRQGSGHQQ